MGDQGGLSNQNTLLVPDYTEESEFEGMASKRLQV